MSDSGSDRHEDGLLHGTLALVAKSQVVIL